MQHKNSRHTIRQWALCVFLPLFFFGMHVSAQELSAPPELVAVDPHGVNLATGHFVLPGLDVGIGMQGSGLNRQTNEKSDNHTNKLSFVYEPDPTADGYAGWMAFYANLFGKSHRFHVGYWSANDGYVIFDDEDSTYTSFSRQDTITCTGDVALYYKNGICTLTLADGTVAVYEHSNGRSDKGGTWYVKTVTMPSGEVLSYTYYTDSYSKVKEIKSVSTSLGWMLKYEINANYQVVKVTAINTSEVYCDPDASSCSVSSSYPYAAATINGNTTTISRNGETLVTYTKDDDTVTVTSPSGVVKTIQYDDNDRVASVSVGNQTWLYRSTGTATTVTNPDQTTYYYSKDKWLAGQLRTETGRVTEYTYDFINDRGRLESINDGGVISSYAYDSRGNIVTITVTNEVDGSALETNYVFPALCSNIKTCNKPTSVTYPDGRTVEYTYYSHGGIETTTTYAKANQPIQTRYYYTQYTPYIKSSSGALVAQPKVWRLTKTSSCMTATGDSCVGTLDERITMQTYTGNNVLPYQSTNKLGDNTLPQVITFDYTTRGQVNWVDGPKPGSVDRSYTFYDSLGRIMGSIGADPDGTGLRPRPAKRITYSVDGQVATSESGTVTGTTASSLDNMIVVSKIFASYSNTTGLPIVTRRYEDGVLVALSQTSYDSRLRPLCQAERLNSDIYGSVTSISACSLGAAGPDGNDRITRYSYTDDSQIASVINAYGTFVATTTFTRNYNSDGTLDTILDANNNITKYSYDGLRRLTSTCYAKPADGMSINWSDCTKTVYRSDGRIDSTTLRDGQNVTYSYDLLGRVIGKAGSISESLSYNNFNQIISHTNNGVTEQYTYNALGWLKSHAQLVGTVNYGYDSYGKRETLTYPDGFVVTYGYSEGNELTSLTTSSGGASVGFIYDNRGRRSQLTRSNGRNTTYGYDLGRLDALTHAGLNTIDLGYSSANQITLKINSDAAYDYDPIEQASQLYVNDGLNRIKSIDGVALGYDGRGNLTQDAEGNQYQYNAKNLVTSATASGAGVSLSYNASDRLLSVQKAGTSETRFLYDNADLIAEYNTSGTLLRRYIHGPAQDEPLIWYEGAGTSSPRFLHADHQGSIIAITNSSGSVLNINTYDEFGNKHSTNEAYTSRFAYTGQVWLKELGLYYYKARMYDAKLGRFLQTDPIGYQDGMNWYAYTSGDPVSRRDPTGLSSTTCSNDPGVCQPPIEEVHVYGSMSGSSWSCEGWVCQDFLRDIFRTQDAQEGSLRETEAQRRLRLSGDVGGYYKARTAAGDAYAARALMVVQNQCTSFDACLMASANFGLHGTAFINRVYVDTRDVQLRLMNAHALAVEADNLGVPGLLNPTQITVYHHQVFTGLGLPKATFGGTPLTGQLWEVGIWGGLWCKGCDTQ